MIIPLHNKDGVAVAWASCDSFHYDRIAPIAWHLDSYGYAACRVRLKCGQTWLVKMHNAIIYPDDLSIKPSHQLVVDHINGDRVDNRSANLRVCTRGQNLCNRGKTSLNTSGYKGVVFHQKKWKAQIGFQGRHRYIGVFDTQEEAHIAYCAKAKELHGEFFNPGAVS